MWNKLLCLLASVGAALAQTESLVVDIEQGPVRGYKDAQGGIYSFMDIPFATAPTGTNKFKAPLPPPTWTEPFDAVSRRIVCPQSLDPSTAAFFTMQEDCLVTNIFVPDTNATNLPVLVSVYGGAYVTGAGFFYPITSLARSQRTIVVTFNYRLQIHGFLCLGTEDIPGNAGMKDQVALLRWVNKNIASFGGNPDDVTITGCSAGGGSVDFLTISPMTKGLFKKAITESGAVIGLAGPQIDPTENAKMYAKQLNFTNVDDFWALEEFYKTASHDLLLSQSDYILQSTYNNAIITAPCVERDTGGEMFLHDTPLNILATDNYHKVPLLYGFAEMEGLVREGSFSDFKDAMNSKFSDFLPADLKFENEEKKEEVAARIKQFYFEDQEVSEETILAFIDYFTDVMFGYPMLRAGNIRRAQGDTIHLYEYSFVDENTPFVPHTNVRGPYHCSQLVAVMDEDVTNATEEYKAMKETMRAMWLDFIETGNPSPEGSSLPPWPPMSGAGSPFMSLNATSRVETSSLLNDRVRFWDTIYNEHYLFPIPPTGSASISAVSFVLLATTLLINYTNY